eukprot:CAMPEP_0168345228 /NCGR_PEP_ID=MMETSP0213-20121227/17419_1 /TAXON_ID=151035 /ORGANISM="Euplotes harpa, Strain FSP1.4" /LENGTH=175 /DNA_ID=CAMNT_0008353385 /DNA_START=12 /DNA_END=540 /DNA_ORIENTATION=+
MMFAKENTDFEDDSIHEGVQAATANLGKCLKANYNVLKSKGHLKSSEQQQFKNDLMVQLSQQHPKSRSACDLLDRNSEVCHKHPSKNNSNLKDDIKMLLKELVMSKKSKSNDIDTNLFDPLVCSKREESAAQACLQSQLERLHREETKLVLLKQSYSRAVLIFQTLLILQVTSIT